jgi:hypothetical protein
MPNSPNARQVDRALPRQIVELRLAYRELLQARRLSSSRRKSSLAYPVGLPSLRGKGVPHSALLLMLYQGHIEHFHLGETHRNDRHVPQRVDSLLMQEFSAFALTEAGDAYAKNALNNKGMGFSEDALRVLLEMLNGPGLHPRYNKEDRLLTWGVHVVKRFRQPAGNQELLLIAAEELGWPAWFDDPLPRAPGQNPKVRLHNSINALNRNQKSCLIHFKGDGSARRMGWEYR